MEVHSENKQGAAPHYKGGYGFHPMICSTADGEPLWAKLRPGNAAANDIADHIEVLDAAVSVLPAADAAGHREGDDAALGDASWCCVSTPGAARRASLRHAGTATSRFHVRSGHRGHRRRIAAARCDPRRWTAAAPNPKQRHPKAHVAELTDLADLSGWPARTRLIIRREPLHPGAQRSLFASENFRCWGFLTDATAGPARLDKLMRKHADVEDAVARLKDSGLARMPFTAWDANCAWAALCTISAALVHWFQTRCLTGPLKRAAPNGSAGSCGTCPRSYARPADASSCGSPPHTPAPKPCSPPSTPTEHPAPPSRQQRRSRGDRPAAPTHPCQGPTPALRPPQRRQTAPTGSRQADKPARHTKTQPKNTDPAFS